VSPSLCNRWRNGTSFFRLMKQAPTVVLSASALNAPRPAYASGSSVLAALPRSGASAIASQSVGSPDENTAGVCR
jgi:hypothetical protein